MSTTPFTGFTRQRTSSRRVRIGDRLARTCITIGGMTTIVAVSLVCGFLVWVVLPLFFGSGIAAGARIPATAAAATANAPLLLLDLDPYQQTALLLHGDGSARLVALRDGETIDSAAAIAPGDRILAAHDEWVASATTDGAVRLSRLRIAVAPIPPLDVPDAARALAVDAGQRLGTAWIERTNSDFRRTTLSLALGEPVPVGAAALVRLDFVPHGDAVTLAAITAAGRLELRSIERRVNPFTDEIEAETRGAGVALAELGVTGPPPDRVLVAGTGDNVYLVWNDGRMVRIDSRDVDAPRAVESLTLLGDGAQVTACAFAIGHNTLLVGDDRGRVRAWFRTKPEQVRGSDGSQLDLAHEFAVADAPITWLSPSRRGRMFAAAATDGTIAVLHATSERRVGEVRQAADQRPLAVAIAPKDDGLLVASDSALQRYELRPGHPEFRLGAVALPVWYEGYPRPEHVWQSTSGTDDFEPKLGLWPLVFGTLKATLYCLLFGVPLALLAAIYTSEFLHPRQRARIKPVVESMASLPSVVLGFLAALVFAPLVESWLATIAAAVFTVPLVWLFGAQIVQSLPQTLRLACERARVPAAAVAVPVGLLLAAGVGALAERVLFDGDVHHWLAASHRPADERGSAFGGWLLLLLPVAAAVVALRIGRFGWFAQHRAAGPIRLALGVVATLTIAMLAAALPTLLGWDLRGWLIDTYVQRNALVVGFVMGFAVIPIIYTIAEDALAAVPEHLRAASLGAGATPWQTAVRVILPTAMSGIFSAIMVGLGRAVGETMIVLMAAGNTPILELNPFNGFRTLSANIAVELQEAVRDSTHYRMLYLAALVLFALTLVLNTVAELVRQRFRKRAWQL